MNRIFLLALIVLAGCSGSSSPKGISMKADDWTFEYSPGMPQHPSSAGSGFVFSFVNYDGAMPCANDQACPGVHYLTTPTGSLARFKSVAVTGTIAVSSGTQFRYRTEPANTCAVDAHARLFLEQAVDNEDFHRFWSDPVRIGLTPGDFAVTVPFDASNWTSVFGHRDAAQLVALLGHIRRIGMTFGGGCFYGHGVSVTGGTAYMTVTAFRVQ